jgi:hypothetical protein
MVRLSMVVGAAGTVYLWLTVLAALVRTHLWRTGRLLDAGGTTAQDLHRLPEAIARVTAGAIIVTTIVSAVAVLVAVAFPVASLRALSDGHIVVGLGSGAVIWAVSMMLHGPRIPRSVDAALALVPEVLWLGGRLMCPAPGRDDERPKDVEATLSSESYSGVASR